MNELLMQLLGFGGGGQFQNPTNYGPPSGGYGPPQQQQTPPQQQYIGNNPNVGFTDPGGKSPDLNQNYPGMMPLANIGPNDAGGNKGGRPAPTPRGMSSNPPQRPQTENDPNNPLWHGLTNQYGKPYGWAPVKGTPQDFGWNPWEKGVGFTRIPGFKPPGQQ